MTLLHLFFTFFKIGAFTFGGGYAMLPLIQAEVLKNGWLAEKDLINFIAVSESTPGPFAVNISTYIGTIRGSAIFGSVSGGVFGAFCATMGVVLPSFIIILIVALFFEKFKESHIIKGIMSGLKAAVIGLIGGAVISVGKSVLFPDGFSLSVFGSLPFYVSLGIFGVSVVLAFKKVHPILIICLCAALGIAFGYCI